MTDPTLRAQLDAWKKAQREAGELRCRQQADTFRRMGFTDDDFIITEDIGAPGSAQVVLRHTHDPDFQHPRPSAG
jgi:hypothetical protein